MKADRDSFVILLTFIPIVVCLILFLLWRASGSGPFDLPSVSLPEVALPAISVTDMPGLSGVVSGVQSMGRNAKSLAIGIGVGIVAGLLIAGIILDITRGARKLATARRNSDSSGTSN